jgi:hypothetical protein
MRVRKAVAGNVNAEPDLDEVFPNRRRIAFAGASENIRTSGTNGFQTPSMIKAPDYFAIKKSA